MTGLLRLVVLTPEKRLLDAEQVAWLRATLIDGNIGIYPGHAPLLGETVAGAVQYADQSAEHTIELEAGILWIDKNTVTIFSPGPFGSVSSEAAGEQIDFERLAGMVAAAMRSNQSNAK